MATGLKTNNIVAGFGDNVAVFGDIVAGVDGALGVYNVHALIQLWRDYCVVRRTHSAIRQHGKGDRVEPEPADPWDGH